jgi:hypothetical protein
VLTVADCWGGAEIHTVALCRTLAARGAEVTIVQLGHDVYERGALNGWRISDSLESLRLGR